MLTKSSGLKIFEKIVAVLATVMSALEHSKCGSTEQMKDANADQIDAVAYERIQRYKYHGL